MTASFDDLKVKTAAVIESREQKDGENVSLSQPNMKYRNSKVLHQPGPVTFWCSKTIPLAWIV